VSLLNPNAILDTVGVIGAAIAAQEVTGRTAFAGGALTASWVWFVALQWEPQRCDGTSAEGCGEAPSGCRAS
jgi:arginine exporter protein ArgO